MTDEPNDTDSGTHDAAVSALYRRARAAGPSAAMDARILAAAAERARRRRRGWFIPASSAAVIVLGSVLVLRMVPVEHAVIAPAVAPVDDVRNDRPVPAGAVRPAPAPELRKLREAVSQSQDAAPPAPASRSPGSFTGGAMRSGVRDALESSAAAVTSPPPAPAPMSRPDTAAQAIDPGEPARARAQRVGPDGAAGEETRSDVLRREMASEADAVAPDEFAGVRRLIAAGRPDAALEMLQGLLRARPDLLVPPDLCDRWPAECPGR